MSNYANNLILKTEELGTLTLGPRKNKLIFDTHIKNISGKINRQKLISIGDVVYSLFYGKQLYKIGKAAGSSGLYDRMKQYQKCGSVIGPTNKKIVKSMKEKSIDQITIRIIKCPRIKKKIKHPITGSSITIHIETAYAIEQRLIQEAYAAGEKLPWCQEVKK
jgi:hypothetical protein